MNFEYVWYDYTCIPQNPRDQNEEIIFQKLIYNLNSIFQSKIKTLPLGNKDKQKTRAWCVLEQELSKKEGGTSLKFEEFP